MVDVREATGSDLPFLEQMLYEAYFWDIGAARPPLAQVRSQPAFASLLAGWGRAGDAAKVAEDAGGPVGAAWFRLWTVAAHSYGFVDERTPEVGLAVAAGHRGRGLGRSLLRALIEAAKARRHPALSLSVAPLNPARALYESEGFRKVGAAGTSWTLLLEL